MARNVFISFRYSDGHELKDELSSLFGGSEDTVDFSEDEDRSHMNEGAIRQFLYGKLKKSSVTIILLTPNAIDYNVRKRSNTLGNNIEEYYDDWIYDGDWDSYCSLVAYDDFKANFGEYIDNAYKKRNELYKYKICKIL